MSGRAVRVHLPVHLRRLAGTGAEVTVQVEGPCTVASVITAVEADYPVLVGAIRDRVTGKRRAFVRYFACEQDLSHDPDDHPLPEAVADGREPLLVVGAMAGG